MLRVLKIGGSVLRSDESYALVAAYLRERLAQAPAERLVVIVSARHGVTDTLLAAAERAVAAPDQIALDLLWSTGELASVALLTLHLQREGVAAAPLNVHQVGLQAGGPADPPGVTGVRPLRVLAALATARVAVVPGFLAVRPGGAIGSLGRGGSDLTAVLLALALRADSCELVKDVAGYYTADPHADPSATHIRNISIDTALAMAEEGCDLVQPAALRAAAAGALPLTVRCLDAAAPVTHVEPVEAVQPRSESHGVRHEDHPRRATV